MRRDLGRDAGIAVEEGVFAGQRGIAGEFLPALAEAAAQRLRERDGVVEQHVGRAPALLLVGPLGQQRALSLGGVGDRVGIGSDAGHAEFRIGRAGQ